MYSVYHYNMAGDAVNLYDYQNRLLQESRNINTEIDQYNLNTKNGTKNDTEKTNLIQKLDGIEKRIMQDNWDGYKDVHKKIIVHL